MPILAITLRTGLITLNLLAIAAIAGIVAFRILSVRRQPVEKAPQNLATPLEDEVMEGRKLERSLRWAFTFSLILAAGLPLYWLVEPARQEAAVIGFDERAVERGAVLFANDTMHEYDSAKSLLCANCHGADGAGGAAPFVVTPAAQGSETARPIKVSWKAPSLNNVFYRFDDAQVHNILVYGRPGTPMPAWGIAGGGPKNEQAITDLMAYIRSIQISPTRAKATATAATTKFKAEQAGYVKAAESNLTATTEALAALPANATPQVRSAAESAVTGAQAALARSEASSEAAKNASEGALLFETNCARCHTNTWSYFDPSNPLIPDLPLAGSGALGPSLRGGTVLLQFPGTPIDNSATPGFQKQYEWISVGAGVNKAYGVRGISSGQMPHMGLFLTKAQIESIVRYERGL